MEGLGITLKVKDIGEFGLINKISQGLINRPALVVKGIGDDAAVLKTDANKLILYTTDMMIEEVHFSLKFSEPRDIGWKALAVNISDIAAMGGIPTNALISIGIPGESDLELIEGIYWGIREAAKEYQLNIVGGDTVKSRELIINVALMGEVEKDKVLYRSGAKDGDAIYVTGTLGDSAGGLHLLLSSENPKEMENKEREKLKKRHLAPRPRQKEALLLVESGMVTSMNDISDGLASELSEIGKESNVGCTIYAQSIPTSEEANNLAQESRLDPLDWALYGGEDFELVLTVKSEKRDSFARYIQENQLNVQRIGEINSRQKGLKIIDSNGEVKDLVAKGYNHFGAV